MAVSTLIFGNRCLGILMFVALIIRMIFLRVPKVLIISLIFGGWCSLICFWQLSNIDKRHLTSVDNQLVTLRAQADELKLTSDYFYGQATLLDTRQRVLFSGPIKDNAQLAQLNHKRQPVLIVANANIQNIEPATNRNQFDAQAYYRSKQITNSIKLRTIKRIEFDSTMNLVDQIHSFRKGLIDYAEQLPKSLNLYVLSLIIGEMSSDGYDEISGIKQLGLIHLFSISGLHVYYFINLLERLLIYLGWRREHYQIMLMLILPLYFIFSGASVGLLRAILMMEATLITKWFQFKISALDVWSIALILNLMIAPSSLLFLGSQLSYGLSFGLIFTSHFSFLKQTGLMNLISIPFVIFHVYEWHVLTFLANWLVLPLFSVLIFPIVIIGMLVDPFLPIIATWIAYFLNLFNLLINWLGALPGNILFGKPNVWLVVIAVILTMKLIDCLTALRFGSLIGCYLLMFVTVHFPIHGEVTYFDIGQGDSFLIREPFNRTVNIIDTGGKVTFGRQTAPIKYNAEKTSINYLKSIGINRVDNLFITHQDADHSGDLPAFLNHLRVNNIIIPTGMQNNPHFMSKINVNIDRVNLILGRDGMQFANDLIRIYHPFEPGSGKNEDSLVLSSNVDQRKWLFTGDLDQNGELKVINKYPELRTNVLKVGHHGSKTSTADAFLKQLQPQVAIISAGRNNRYGHPNDEVLKRLDQFAIKTYNTQLDGMITYRYGGFAPGDFETILKR
ncbi:DNA internalization-related competence protein ComEC/Rec2 [Lactobacillaceae bacterium Melli_B3]